MTPSLKQAEAYMNCVNSDLKDDVIRMAWEDRTTFEEIEERTGLVEAEVIKVMRANLKAGSFRRWRKRVSGRVTKHRKRFGRSRQKLKSPTSRSLQCEAEDS